MTATRPRQSKIQNPKSKIRALFLCAIFFCGAILAGETPAPVQDDPDLIPPRPAFAGHHAEHLRIGRELFATQAYPEAFKSFTTALALDPKNREAGLLAGLAAYWSRKPEEALAYWNPLLDRAKRNSVDEWELERNRVMALSAMGQFDAAEQVVARLYELRREAKLPEALYASGFVREHLYAQDLRAGCWEIMDDRHEVQDLWRFSVVSNKVAAKDVLKTLAVSAEALPGGGTGFVLREETLRYRCIYKRWIRRPAYDEVRALVMQALEGRLKPLEQKEAGGSPAIAQQPSTINPAGPVAKPLAERVPSETEQALSTKIRGLKLDPAAAHILLIAIRLREVSFDVTRLTRLSLTDRELAEGYLRELSGKAPGAQEDAAELVDLIASAKSEHLNEAFTNWMHLGARKPYLDFALLTAVNTRGRDAPAALVGTLLDSPDFMVRSTAALILARQGERRGLERIFKEIATADAVGCSVLSASLEDLTGSVLGAPPQTNASGDAVKAWQRKAAAWWLEHGAELQYRTQPKVDEAFWKVAK